VKLGYYILKNRKPVEVTFHEFVENHREHPRTVLGPPWSVMRSENKPRNLIVSTVFLGLDHNYSGHGPPLLFETMVFQDGKSDTWGTLMRRHSTWGQAAQYHVEVLKFLAEELDCGNRKFFETISADDQVLIQIFRRKLKLRIRAGI
jgi:hypothetical protein